MENGDIIIKKYLCMKIKMAECLQNRRDNQKVLASVKSLTRFIRTNSLN